jgi:probable HAF family extracellular repeat protein
MKTPYTDLGHFKGGTWAEACNINNAGIVVGFGSIPKGYTRPLAVPATGPNTGMWFDLGTLGGERTDWKVMAMGVSDTGIISGHSARNDGTIHAFVWTPDAGMSDIGTLNGDSYSASSNMNRRGTIITGWSGNGFFGDQNSDGTYIPTEPVVWTPSPKWQEGKLVTVWKIQQLDTTGFESYNPWLVNAANDYAQLVGLSVSPHGLDIPMMWTPGPGGWSVSQLPIPPGFDQGDPSDINDKGEIAGSVGTAGWGTWSPVVWKPLNASRTTYTYVLLAPLTGSSWAEANGINDLGDVVGDSWDASGNNDVAVVWNLSTPDTVQSLGLPDAWNVATKINDLRMIVAYYAPDWTYEYVKKENVVTVQLH